MMAATRVMSRLVTLRRARRSSLTVVRPLSTAADKSSMVRVPLFQRAQKYKDRIAIGTPEGEHTYRQLLSDSSTLSRHMVDCALASSVHKPDFPVAFLCPRDYSYVATLYAVWQAGGIAVPLCDTHPAPELEYTIQDSNAAVVVVHPEYESMVQPIAKKLHVPVLPLREFLGSWCARVMADPLEVQVSELGMSRHDGHYDVLATPQNIRPHSERAMLIYTSGTTGRPKGVLTTHSIVTNQITSLIQAWRWTEDDRLLHTLPLHHVHGVVAGLLSALWAGAECDMRKGFSAAGVWSDLAGTDAHAWNDSTHLPPSSRGIHAKPISLYMAVPTIYSKLIQYYEKNTQSNTVLREELRQACMSRLRLMVSGSAPLAVPVMKQWENISGHVLLERYGMTEIGLVISNPYGGTRMPVCVRYPEAHFSNPQAPRMASFQLGTIGRPLAGTELRLMEEKRPGEFVEVAPGQSGELWVSGATVFDSYWNRPDATEEAFRDGWFRTGDEAVCEQGVYRILGRMSADVLKTGGYKVSALEIENVLLEDERIGECCVVGVADVTWGQRVAALVVPAPGYESLTLEDIQTFAKQRMASYKVPSVMRVLSTIPRNAMGKINKKSLVKDIFG